VRGLEYRRAIRVRWTFEKNERYRHLELPDDLFAASPHLGPSRRGSARIALVVTADYGADVVSGGNGRDGVRSRRASPEKTPT